MHASSPLRKLALCALVGGGLFGLAWAGRSAGARQALAVPQFSGVMVGGGFGGAEEAPPPGRVVYLRESLGAKALAVRSKLAQPVDMEFPNEIPLGDLLKYVAQATAGPEMERGIPIYVDPVGLQEAEKTLDSTVAIDLRGVPLAKSLTLALKQLGLAYTVDDDGLLLVTSEGDPAVPRDPPDLILEELARLRQEVAELKTVVGGARPRGGAAAKQ